MLKYVKFLSLIVICSIAINLVGLTAAQGKRILPESASINGTEALQSLEDEVHEFEGNWSYYGEFDNYTVSVIIYEEGIVEISALFSDKPNYVYTYFDNFNHRISTREGATAKIKEVTLNFIDRITKSDAPTRYANIKNLDIDIAVDTILITTIPCSKDFTINSLLPSCIHTAVNMTFGEPYSHNYLGLRSDGNITARLYEDFHHWISPTPVWISLFAGMTLTMASIVLSWPANTISFAIGVYQCYQGIKRILNSIDAQICPTLALAIFIA